MDPRDERPRASPTTPLSPGAEQTLDLGFWPSAPPQVDPGRADTVTTEASGRYEQRHQLGAGGMGIVHAALDRHLGREIAVKEQLGSSTARFLREARVTAQLEHPGIIPVHELGRRPDGTLYYTMRRVRGRTLAEALSAATGLDARLRLIGHFADLCHAVAFAHSRGVVHRDLKPGNVMVGAFGETVLLDWGLARVGADAAEPGAEGLEMVAAGLTMQGARVGTPMYMSPEQAAGRLEEVDARSDVWALGVILYEWLAGRPLFGGATAAEILESVLRDDPPPLGGVPPELAAVAARAMARDRDARYPNAAALAADIVAWQTGGRVSAYRYSRWDELARVARKYRREVRITAAATIALSIAGGLAWREQVRHAAETQAALVVSLRDRARAALDSGDAGSAAVFAANALLIEDEPVARGAVLAALGGWMPARTGVSEPGGLCAQLAWARDGSRLGCASADGLFVREGDAWRALDVPACMRPFVAFVDPDAIDCLGADGALHGWDLATLLPLPDWSVGPEAIEGRLRPDGDLPGVAWDATGARGIDAGGDELWSRPLAHDPVRLPGGRVALVTSEGGWITDGRTGAELKSVPGQRWWHLTGIGGTLLGWGARGDAWSGVVTIDPTTFRESAVAPSTRAGLHTIAGLGDLVLGASPRRIEAWRLPDLRLVGSAARARATARAIAPRPDGSGFELASPDHVEHWRLARATGKLDGIGEPASYLAVLDATHIATSTLSGTAGSGGSHLLAWDLVSGDRRDVALPGTHVDAILPLDAHTLLGADAVGLWRIDLAASTAVRVVDVLDESYRLLRVGGLVVSAGHARVVDAWDPSTWERRWELPVEVSVAGLFELPEGLVVVTFRGDAHLLDPATGKERATAEMPGIYCNPVASPDGTQFAWGTRQGVRIASRKWPPEVTTDLSTTDGVTSVAWRGDHVAASLFDGTVDVWDASTGRLLANLWSPSPNLWSVALTEDGSTVLAVGADGDLHRWDLAELKTPAANLVARLRDGYGLELADGDVHRSDVR